MDTSLCRRGGPGWRIRGPACGLVPAEASVACSGSRRLCLAGGLVFFVGARNDPVAGVLPPLRGTGASVGMDGQMNRGRLFINSFINLIEKRVLAVKLVKNKSGREKRKSHKKTGG